VDGNVRVGRGEEGDVKKPNKAAATHKLEPVSHSLPNSADNSRFHRDRAKLQWLDAGSNAFSLYPAEKPGRQGNRPNTTNDRGHRHIPKTPNQFPPPH
jgi:hypothetical protein